MASIVRVRLIDDREVCFAHGIAIAAFIPGRGYVRRVEGKHSGQFAGYDSPLLPEEEFARLIAPLVVS